MQFMDGRKKGEFSRRRRSFKAVKRVVAKVLYSECILKRQDKTQDPLSYRHHHSHHYHHSTIIMLHKVIDRHLALGQNHFPL